ncbi:MAG: PP2C family protein-serine/threonine phosphatase, partial [Candidatus Eiseniibacteriota bacterium]
TDADSFAPPERLLARLNHQLARALPEGWFLTACYAILDPGSGRIEYSLAGHEAPVVVRADRSGARQFGDCGGPPLGPFPDATFDSRSEELEPGDTVVFFTDGITEAVNPSLDMFGTERLIDSLRAAADSTLDAAKRDLLTTLLLHTAGFPLRDDSTLLMLRRSAEARIGRGLGDRREIHPHHELSAL